MVPPHSTRPRRSPAATVIAVMSLLIASIVGVVLIARASSSTSAPAVATPGVTSTAASAIDPPPARSSTEPPGATVPPTTLALSPALAGVPARVYVPNGLSNTVSIIDPAARRVVGTFATGREPQHIVPAYDLRQLWVLDNKGNSLIPIDPMTQRPGKARPVQDPYNLYFTPDGVSAIVVAEQYRRLDFRDPQTMRLTSSLPVPDCNGLNHIDYSGDYRYVIATCEFNGKLAKVDWANRKVLGMLQLPAPEMPGMAPMMAMPQDIRVAPDGRTFYVADMTRGGLYVIDGASFQIKEFIPTGIGTHGLTPSRDGTKLYVANRGSTSPKGRPHGPGSIAVFDIATNRVIDTWSIPGGGSPDMGNLSTDGSELWLAGRFDSEVYVFDCIHGGLAARIPVGAGPHGLTYWPQPGHFSLGHTGNMR